MASTDGAGNAGTVSVQASTLNIGSNAGIVIKFRLELGAAGIVHATVTGAINMTGNSRITGRYLW